MRSETKKTNPCATPALVWVELNDRSTPISIGDYVTGITIHLVSWDEDECGCAVVSAVVDGNIIDFGNVTDELGGFDAKIRVMAPFAPGNNQTWEVFN